MTTTILLRAARLRRGCAALIAAILFAGASPASAQISFSAPVTYNVGAPPRTMTTADLNGDGFRDVVLTTDQGVVALMNNGDGSLGLFQPLSSGNTNAVLAADLNGDGVPDLAFVDGHGLGVLINRGDGTFRAVTDYDPGAGPYAVTIAAGDFDGDGDIDVALLTVWLFGAAPTVSIFNNRGDGIFSVTSRIGLPDGGDYVVAADVNNDGYADLITANGNTNGATTVSVFINLKNGVFAPAVNYSSALPASRKILIADTNGDRSLDIVLLGFSNYFLGVMLNNGNGTFGSPIYLGTRPYIVTDGAIADVDGDGKLDLVGTVGGSNGLVFRGLGDGTFEAPATLPVGATESSAVVADDLDGNGAVDVVVSDIYCHCSLNINNDAIDVVLNQRLPPVDRGLQLSTDHGGNAGSVTLTILGTGIAQRSAATLNCTGQLPIQGTETIVGADGTSLTTTFSLLQATAGSCVVSLMSPDGTTRTASQLFTVEIGGAPQIWVDVVGFDKIRVGRDQSFYVTFGNRGNVDADDASFWVSFPASLQWAVVSSQQPIAQMVSPSGNVLLAFEVAHMPAGSATSPIILRMTASLGPPFELRAWSGQP